MSALKVFGRFFADVISDVFMYSRFSGDVIVFCASIVRLSRVSNMYPRGPPQKGKSSNSSTEKLAVDVLYPWYI